jgi:hypothetical protein
LHRAWCDFPEDEPIADGKSAGRRDSKPADGGLRTALEIEANSDNLLRLFALISGWAERF